MSMVYFDFMSKEKQKIVRWWVRGKRGFTPNQEEFFNLVKKALKVVKKAYYIANIEPSVDESGRIYYAEGHKVALGLWCQEWKKKAQEFAPEHKSDLATKYQLVLWYAYRIAIGLWTIEYVCDDSSSSGNYWNSPNATHEVEMSGARRVGGAKDGVGNTFKVVTDGEEGFCLFGSTCWISGHISPVFHNNQLAPTGPCNHSVGVLVLNKD